MSNPEATCDCNESSCPIECGKKHTHKNFFCEVCSPVSNVESTANTTPDASSSKERIHSPSKEPLLNLPPTVEDWESEFRSFFRGSSKEHDEQIEELCEYFRTHIALAEKRGAEKAAKIVEEMMEDSEHWQPIVQRIKANPPIP